MAVLYAFFSYAHRDAELDPELFAAFSSELEKRISAQFVNDQLNIWRDENGLLTGYNWDATIEASLRESRLLIVMLSPRWLGSEYCHKEFSIFREVERQLGSDKLVIPILLRDVESKKKQLNAEQLELLTILSERQFKKVLVENFLKLDDDDRKALVEGLAREISPRLEPYFEAANAIKIAAPAPRPQLTEAFKIDAPAKPFERLTSTLGGVFGGALKSVFSTTKTPPPLPPHNLPLRSIGDLFMGRDAIMDTIKADLAEKPVLALHGMGGVGKTRLAVEYAWRRAADYTAALFISAETPELLNAGLAGLATTLNLPEKENPQDPPKIAAALRWLAENTGWLLVLDNVDDETAAPAVIDLLPKLISGQTLITARYDKFPGSVPTRRVDVLAPEDAREFLLARTKDRRRADANDPALAAKLAEKLGHLALALEQAGAFICAQKISFERYLAYWRDERARVVDYFDKTAMGVNHDIGLSAVWATSVARLSANGRRLFERLAFLAPEPIPEFLLDVKAPSSFGTAAAPPPQDEGAGAHAESGPHAEERPQDASRSTRAASSSFETPAARAPQDEDAVGDDNAPFDARAALGELYAYSLAAPSEVEGRYRQDAFSVHRLVQDFGLRSMSEARRSEMLRETLNWVNAAFEGDPDDVRTWPRLDPLAVHAESVAEAADKAGIADPTARLLNQIGLMLQAQARFEAAEPLYRRALAIVEKSYGPDHPNVAIRLNNLAGLLHATNRHAEAEPLFRRARAIDEKSFGPDHPDVAIDLNNLAGLLHATNRHAEAEPLYRRALAIDEESFGPDHPNVAIRLNNLAELLRSTNRHAEAEPLFRRALAIDEKIYGRDHPEVATDLNNLAGLLRATGRLAEAEPLYRRALAIGEKSLGADHPNVAIRLNNLASLLQITRRFAEAEPLYRRALAIDEKSYGPDHPDVAIRLNNLAVLLYTTNRLAEAEPLFRRALAIGETSLGPDHAWVANPLNNLALLLRATGRLAEAEPLFHRAVKILAASLGPDHPSTKTVAENYRRLLRQRGASEEEAEAKAAAALRGE